MFLILYFVLIFNFILSLSQGPFAWPLIGNLHLFHNLSRDCGGQHLALLELSRRYNSDVIALKLGRNNVIAVSGQKANQTVLKNEDYDGRPWNEFIKLRNMGLRKGMLFHLINLVAIKNLPYLKVTSNNL